MCEQDGSSDIDSYSLTLICPLASAGDLFSDVAIKSTVTFSISQWLAFLSTSYKKETGFSTEKR